MAVLTSRRMTYRTSPNFSKAATDLYGTGQDFMKGVEASLSRLQTKTMSAGMQNLVSSGLAGTTMAGNLASAFAEETVAPALLQANAQRVQSLADLFMQREQMDRQSFAQQSSLSNAYNIASKQIGGSTIQERERARSAQRLASRTPAPQSSMDMISQAQNIKNVSARNQSQKDSTSALASQIRSLASRGGSSGGTGGPDKSYATVGGVKFIYGDDGILRRA